MSEQDFSDRFDELRKQWDDLTSEDLTPEQVLELGEEAQRHMDSMVDVVRDRGLLYVQR